MKMDFYGSQPPPPYISKTYMNTLIGMSGSSTLSLPLFKCAPVVA